MNMNDSLHRVREFIVHWYSFRNLHVEYRCLLYNDTLLLFAIICG